MPILLVEDDVLLAETLVALLKQAGNAVEHIADGARALDRVSCDPLPDWQLVLLDLNLPGAGGLDILARFRCHNTHTPVIILTARGAIADRVKGLDLGADDYIAKPFALDELEARIRVQLRRHDSRNELYRLGPLAFDGITQQITVEDTPLPLPPRELRLLGCFLRHAGKVVDKATLLKEAFGDDEAIADSALDVYIHRLRRRLPDDVVSLRTVRGLGYILDRA
ncbi:response regulator transcription factor [Larsenimonas rhizosphaerae]|uniref:response regulator transcription factor n=1 Tax=Larsenimonas rhizosphaerae TaxID=2944682 RepID=UPI002033E7F5|nr:response regulator transcription factor [Larsenimonas rhizosphaerae]MCM2132006.1 response regulator transcription factor [Larsenimonas rhizosphaerae]